MAEGGLKVTRKEPKDIWVRGLRLTAPQGPAGHTLSLPFFCLL